MFVSEKSNMLAPTIGDNGYVGLIPSLEVKRDYISDSGRKGCSFGWLYEGLKSINLITYEIENYKAFLEANSGNVIHLITGYDKEVNPKIDMENLIGFKNIPNKDFKSCTYKLENTLSGEFVFYDNKYQDSKLIPCQRTITTDEVDKFITQFKEADIWHEFYHLFGLLAPSDKLEEIVKFVSNNQGNELALTIDEI
jgi:hypothetical protein